MHLEEMKIVFFDLKWINAQGKGATWLSCSDLMQSLGSGRPTALQYWHTIHKDPHSAPQRAEIGHCFAHLGYLEGEKRVSFQQQIHGDPF